MCAFRCLCEVGGRACSFRCLDLLLARGLGCDLILDLCVVCCIVLPWTVFATAGLYV